MLGPDPMSALYLALEETPGDRVTLLALADCYLDDGNQIASTCLRWSAARARFPFRYVAGQLAVLSSDFLEGWYWWGVESPHLALDWGHPPSCRLPRDLWRPLRHSFAYSPAVYKQYPTLRIAYEALMDAWPLAPAADRALVRREASR